MSEKRRHYTAQEKVAILKRHLLDKVPISDLCDQYAIHPTLFYHWQKAFFEHGHTAFEQSCQGRHGSEAAKDRKIAALEEKLQRKNEVLAELMEEHVQLKKELGEP
jgi:transposase-like protein